MNMYNSHNITTFFKLIFSLCFLLALSACGSNDDNAEKTETVTEIPQFIQKLALDTGDPNAELLAWITIDNGTPIQMTIDILNGTATASISLSREVHTVLIEFEFTDGVETITLATASKDVDLSDGNASLTFEDLDYITDFDDDGDGIPNLQEIIGGTDPLVQDASDCILDTSVIGNCILG